MQILIQKKLLTEGKVILQMEQGGGQDIPSRCKASRKHVVIRSLVPYLIYINFGKYILYMELTFPLSSRHPQFILLSQFNVTSKEL